MTGHAQPSSGADAHPEARHEAQLGHGANRRDLNHVADKIVRAPFQLIAWFGRRIGAVMGTTWDRIATAPGRAWEYVNRGRKGVTIEAAPNAGVLGKIQAWTVSNVMKVLATAGQIATAPIALAGEAVGLVRDEAKAVLTGKTQRAPSHGGGAEAKGGAAASTGGH